MAWNSFWRMSLKFSSYGHFKVKWNEFWEYQSQAKIEM